MLDWCFPQPAHSHAFPRNVSEPMPLLLKREKKSVRPFCVEKKFFPHTISFLQLPVFSYPSIPLVVCWMYDHKREHEVGGKTQQEANVGVRKIY